MPTLKRRKLAKITKVSQLFEVIDWDFDGNGLNVTNGRELSEAIADAFPELKQDMEFEDEDGD